LRVSCKRIILGIVLKQTQITYFLLIFLLCGILIPQENVFDPDEEIFYRADTLIGSKENDSPVREYFSNFHMWQNNVDIYSDYAKQFIELDKVRMRGNVKFTQEGLLLLSPRVNYDGQTGIAETFDSVEIFDDAQYIIANKSFYFSGEKKAVFTRDVWARDDSSEIFCDELIYFKESGRTYAYGNVAVFGKYSASILTGDTIISYKDSSLSWALGKPILFQLDSSYSVAGSDSVLTIDTLIISCDTMISIRKEENEMFEFTGNLKLTRNSISAKSDRGFFDKKKEELIIFGSPVAFLDSTQLYGDTIIVNMEDGKIKKISSVDNSISVSRDTILPADRLNQIKGERIDINFVGGEINNILANGNAKSLYYFFNDSDADSPPRSDGLDRKGSDSLKIEFIEGQMENVYWFGGVAAEYFPEHLVEGKADDFYLPGFQWQESRPEIPKRNVRNSRYLESIKK
jgi:lipopolysaccharide export system protein LptA